ncbi:hypothetical protein KAU34_10710 [candidate division WOR-3 bacterium]|nr:hypothetical protein [candidate division WOR-3 bacterium]
MIYRESKIIPCKKRLFSQRWRTKPPVKKDGNYVTVVSLSGFLQRDDITMVDNIIDNNLKEGIDRFIVNFLNVNHINYKDVTLLLEIKEKIDKTKGDIKFVVQKPYIIDILFIGGWPFNDGFYPSERSAIYAFREECKLTWRKDVHNTYTRSVEGSN